MDRLDQLIAATRQSLAQMDAEIAALTAGRDSVVLRLRTLEEAAKLRPSLVDEIETAIRTEARAPRRSGRQAGSISRTWKEILLAINLMDSGDGVSFEEIIRTAQSLSPKATDHSIRDRIRKYRDKLGFVEVVGNKFRIKKEVVEKFSADLGPRPSRDREENTDTTQPEPEDLKPMS